MTELCAVLIVGEEGPEMLRASLATFRARYADAPLAVISDGVDDPAYAGVCARHGAHYVLDRYYARIECGGRWWRRTLAAGLTYATRWIVSIDLSAPCWPNLTTEPSSPVTGLLRTADPEQNRRSGCQAIRRDVAAMLVESRGFDNPDLTLHSRLCPGGIAPRSWVPVGRFAPALALRHVCAQLGVEFGEWPQSRPPATGPPPAPPAGGVALDTPLVVITTCKGRRHHLEQTLPGWLTQPHVSVVVVDYNCPQGTAKWLAANYPAVRVVSIRHQPTFNLARARNIGARAAPPGWWAFLDADTMVAEGWADAVRSSLSRGHYHLALPVMPQTTHESRVVYHGSCIVHSDDFASAGGYDELIDGWGAEDLDLYGRFRQCNIRPASVNSTLAHAITHSDQERTQFYEDEKIVSGNRNGRYVWAKHALMTEAWRLPTSEECRLLRAALTSPLPASPDAARALLHP
jgi:hypothetical protein